MAALGEARVRDLIKTIGLYRTKAKNVVALSRQLVAEHGGQVPRTREALEALPGVGRKTANVVLNVAFGEPTIAVDTHIFRVGNRTGMAHRQEPARGRAEARSSRAGELQAPRAPLAYSARALHLRGAQAAVRKMHHRRLCQWPGKTVAANKRRRELRMEGSARKAKSSIAAIRKCFFGDAGLPPKAGAAWLKAQPRFTGNFKRDAAAGTKFWRDGADLLAKLPKKPQRTPAQTTGRRNYPVRSAAKRAKRFLARHADAIYRKLTKNHRGFRARR